MSLRGDAGSESDVSTMMKLAAQRHGAIDIVVANAGKWWAVVDLD